MLKLAMLADIAVTRLYYRSWFYRTYLASLNSNQVITTHVI